MALYFYFNETTGDLVYSDQATYDAEGYTPLGEQTIIDPERPVDWAFDSKRSGIKTVSKDPAVENRISELTRMISMFANCSSLTSLDLSGFDTSKVTGMKGMFAGCSSLTSLDLSGFDTSKVTSMGYMFAGCSSLTSLDLSGFDTSKITDIIDMFTDCSLDVVRCRPKQFLAAPRAVERSMGLIIPSSSGAWYDFAGAEVTDFSSDVATSLYSDPSKAPDGSKLVNLQDFKAALAAMDGGVDVPFPNGTVLIDGDVSKLFAQTFSIGGTQMPSLVFAEEPMDNPTDPTAFSKAHALIAPSSIVTYFHASDSGNNIFAGLATGALDVEAYDSDGGRIGSRAYFGLSENAGQPMIGSRINNEGFIPLSDYLLASTEIYGLAKVDGTTVVSNKGVLSANVPDTSAFMTKTDADAAYQPKGSYAAASHTHTVSQITDFPEIPEIALATDVEAKGFLGY